MLDQRDEGGSGGLVEETGRGEGERNMFCSKGRKATLMATPVCSEHDACSDNTQVNLYGTKTNYQCLQHRMRSPGVQQPTLACFVGNDILFPHVIKSRKSFWRTCLKQTNKVDKRSQADLQARSSTYYQSRSRSMLAQPDPLSLHRLPPWQLPRSLGEPF